MRSMLRSRHFLLGLVSRADCALFSILSSIFCSLIKMSTLHSASFIILSGACLPRESGYQGGLHTFDFNAKIDIYHISTIQTLQN